MKNKRGSTLKKHILEFSRVTVIVWPELERIALVNPFDSTSMSFDECLKMLKSARKRRRRRGA